MSIIANPGSPKADDSLARQVFKQSARTLSRSRSVWHFMAWSFVVAETAGRDASSYGHGINGQSGDVDISKALASDVAVLQPADLDDNVYISDLEQGSFAGGGAGVAASRTGDAHGEFTITVGAGVPPVEGVATPVSAESAQQIAAVFGAGSYAVGSSSFVSYGFNINWTPGFGLGGLFHEPPPAGPLGGHFGGPIGGPPGGLGGAGQPGTPAAAGNYDGPAIVYASGISPFGEKLGLGVNADAIPTAALAESQGPVTAALHFTNNAFAPVGAWGGLGQNDQPAGLYAGDRADVQYLIQANGYGSLGSTQLQLTNVPADSPMTAQHTNIESKSATNTAVLIDDGGASPLFIKGNYYEYNTIIQINITSNNDTVLVTRTGMGTSDAPSVINTGDNQQHNVAHITDNPQLTQAATTNSDPAISTSVELTGTEPPTAIQDGPHTAVMGSITQHYAAIQISQVLNADTLTFNFDDVVSGNLTDAPVAKFADVNAGGDVQTNTSVMSFSRPISQAGYTAQDFIKSHSGTHVEVIHGDYYKINTIFQLNLALDSDSITKSVGDSLTAAGLGSGNNGGGVLASGGNIELNTASIIKADAQDMFVGGKYTQYNLVLQINALADSSHVTETSAVRHEGMHPTDAFAVGTDHSSEGQNNGADAGSSAFSLPNPLDELALRGGQTADHSL